MKTFILLLGSLGLVLAAPSFAQTPGTPHHMHTGHEGHSLQQNKPAAPTANVGVNEQLGALIPLHLEFNDEAGKPVKLAELVDRPTLLLLIFYSCTRTCNLMLGGLAADLPEVKLKPGKDYRVITVSFDPEEDHDLAAEKKRNYLAITGDTYPANEWRYLTGTQENIKALTEAVGFNFYKQGPNDFIHPNVLISLGADGKVIRYLYGPDFLPFDITMALTEASKGTPGISIKKLVSYCFTYDPKGRKYVLGSMRIIGGVFIILMGVLLFFLLRKRPPST